MGTSPLGAQVTPVATADCPMQSKADETELAFWDSITDSAVASDYVAFSSATRREF